MKITRSNLINNTKNTMDIPALTPELLAEGERAIRNGALIQNAYPYLNANEREFLLTGITPQLWEEIFS